jgi:predicted RNase H-like HicB family nuclease
MKAVHRLTAVIEREDDGYVALCPELDIASEGASIEESRNNLIEALTLFFETASPSEIARSTHNEVSPPALVMMGGQESPCTLVFCSP